MRPWRRGSRSVTTRFRFVLFLVFGVGAILALLAGWNFAGSASDEAFDRLLQSAAVQFLDGATIENGRTIVLPPESAFDTLAIAEDDRFFYSVRAPNGPLLTGYADLPEGKVAAARSISISNVRYGGASLRAVTLRRVVGVAGRDGAVSVTVAQTRSARRVMQLQLFTQSAPITLAIAALGLLGSLLATSLAVRPLAGLEDALKKRDPRDLTPIASGGPQETERLIGAINVLMARLEQRLDKLQQFARLTAHQLRTPLAALASQVDLLANDRDDSSKTRRIERLRTRLTGLNRLIHQLLGHAMIAHRGETAPRVILDVIGLARSVAIELAPDIGDEGRELVFHAPDHSIEVVGDEVMLREAVANLIHNAALHGRGACIVVSVARRADGVTLSVADDGVGLAPELWEMAGEPFGLKSQNATGAGLGLSIVRETAEMHGGRLLFGHNGTGQFEVTILLPDQGTN